ncbi:hypothetical protein ACFL1R_11395 [Candidatus Latescibacterota bacterium]
MSDIQMKSQSEKKELNQLQAENRHLKDTIIALRETLEKQCIENEELVQKAVASANDEIVQLKATVTALRDELEYNNIKNEEKIQEIEKVAHDEIEQLKQLISILRTQLEEQDAKQR